MSELRNVTIAEGIRQSEVSVNTKIGPGNTKIVEYQPGNGTRYVLVINDLSMFSDQMLGALGRSGERCYLVSHVNGGSGLSMTVGGNDFLHYNYVKEKLKVSESDAVVLAEFIAFMCRLEAISCEEYTRSKEERQQEED